DEEMGERLFRLFRELNRRLKTTVLIATHDMALVRRSKADVLRLADGMVVKMPASPGTPEMTA
ncbi:MAG: cell division ATP-binding protein FtsE, partial [Hyphomonadaceae bacterium]